MFLILGKNRRASRNAHRTRSRYRQITADAGVNCRQPSSHPSL